VRTQQRLDNVNCYPSFRMKQTKIEDFLTDNYRIFILPYLLYILVEIYYIK